MQRDIRSFMSYAVGCMLGRYYLDVDGLAFAGGEWDKSKYVSYIPGADNIIPITDEEYFSDDIVGRFVEFVKTVYGEDTLEENLDFIAQALGNKGDISREIIRNYFIKDFYADHLKVYQKRPIYWLFDSGNGSLSPTIAGLLFFGEAYHITEVFPNYFLDYREECDDKAVRWLFRTHSNEGDWSGNIYDFFCKVRTRMDDEVAVPFANRRNGYRVDRVDVHDALEEALANALAHANYYGRRGILVVKKGKELTISNPGTIRVTKEEFYAGGNSDPRNPNILKMFGFVNVGERAGSGVDKILTAWKEQNWKEPEFDFSERSDRVTLKLEVGQVVYIPGAADIRNENTDQAVPKSMSKEEKILDYIRQNGSISTQKVMELCNYKSRTGARNLLEKLMKSGKIGKIGENTNTIYTILE